MSDRPKKEPHMIREDGKQKAKYDSYGRQELIDLVEAMIATNDQVKDVAYRAGQVYLSPKDAFKLFVSITKYRLFGRF